MLVGDRMTREVQTLTSDATVAEGLQLMSDRGFHRLPVVDAEGELVGIVSGMDLRIAEAAGRLADPLSAVMTRRVITIGEYSPLEEAAAVMRERAIGGLPVVRGDKLIGIITERDLFDVFSRLLGVGEPGVRLSVSLPSDRGALVTLLRELTDQGGEIVGLGTMREGEARLMMVKVTGLPAEQAQAAVGIAGAELVDVLVED